MSRDDESCPVCHSNLCDNPTHIAPNRFSGTNPVPSNGNGTGRAAARVVRLTPASTITPRPVHWLWTDRLAVGTFALMGGREGIGKSLSLLTLAADLTQGRLPGQFLGTPKAVILATTEDSWEHTIVPRLMAAGADLTKIFRVDVMTPTGLLTELSLPQDLAALELQIIASDVAMVILDPLLSRLPAKIDSHKDAEVRQALEPLVLLADRTRCTIVGLIHVNKSGSSDALTSLMGSRAFASVARTVLFVVKDPAADDTRLLGLAKNNLGRCDLPTRTFTIRSWNIAPQGTEAIWTGQLVWAEDTQQSLRDILADSAHGESEGRVSAVDDALQFLTEYLTAAGGTADANRVKKAGHEAGHSPATLYRAKTRAKLLQAYSGSPARPFWSLPAS